MDIKMENWIEEYTKELERRGCGRKNIEGWQRTIKRFMSYFEEKGIRTFEDVRAADVEGFLDQVNTGTKLTAQTVNTYRDITRHFLTILSMKITGGLFFEKKALDLSLSYPPEFVRYYEEYTEKKRLEKIPENSLKKARESIRMFYKYLVEARNIDSLMKVNREDIRDFGIYLSEKKGKTGETSLCAESVSRYQSAVKVFLLWLSKKGVCRGMAAHIRNMRRNERLSRNILSRKEMSRLFEVRAENEVEFMMKTVIVLLYSSGVRVSELLAIKENGVDWENGEAVIFETKTGKERRVIFGEVGIKYLKLYYELVRDRITYGETGEVLFVSKREGKKLWNASVNVYLKRFCGRAGIKKKITCHCFRHSFGTHLLENGAGIKQVSELLGHDSLKSTERYTHLNPEHLRQTIMKYHPRECDSREALR